MALRQEDLPIMREQASDNKNLDTESQQQGSINPVDYAVNPFEGVQPDSIDVAPNKENKESFFQKNKKLIGMIAAMGFMSSGLGYAFAKFSDEERPDTTTEPTKISGPVEPGVSKQNPETASNQTTTIPENSTNNVAITTAPETSQATDPKTAEAATAATAPEKELNNGEYTVESLELDAELMNNPEKLAKILVEERITQWFNAGSTPENAAKAFELKDHKYLQDIARKQDSVFIEALIASDKTPRTSQWVNEIALRHSSNIAAYELTIPGMFSDKDNEAYMRGSKFETLVSSSRFSNDTITIAVQFHDYDNSDKNRAGEEVTSYINIAGDTAIETYVLKNNNGKLKIYDVY